MEKYRYISVDNYINQYWMIFLEVTTSSYPTLSAWQLCVHYVVQSRMFQSSFFSPVLGLAG